MGKINTIHALKPAVQTVKPLVTSTVFVKGLAAPELSGTSNFPSEDGEITCYPVFLSEAIDEALDPIRAYILQYDGMADGKDQDLINVLLALEYGARKRLETSLAEAEKHLGEICIRKVSYRNRCSEYKPEEAIAVEMRFES